LEDNFLLRKKINHKIDIFKSFDKLMKKNKIDEKNY